MKKLIVVAVLASISTVAVAQSRTRVQGYVRRDGTYVAPHYRTTPDSNPYNNWSTRGNVNPYTGRVGTVDPYGYRPSYPASGYQRDIDADGQPD